MKRLLLLLCPVLIATIATELSYGTGSDSKPAETVHVMPEATKRPTASRPVAQWLGVALGRPLFSPDRKPIASSSGSAGLPRLAGVIDSPGNAVAIFQGSGNDKPVLVRQGAVIAGWQVMTIAGDTVGLEKAGGRLVIRPGFGNSTVSSATKETKPSPSRWDVAAAPGLLRARWSNPQLQP